MADATRLVFRADKGPGAIGLYHARSGSPEAEYKARYIAVPRSTLAALIGTYDLEEFGVGEVNFFNPPRFSAQTRERMKRIHATLVTLGRRSEVPDIAESDSGNVLIHEFSHHDALVKSVFWLYANLCVGMRRLLIARAFSFDAPVLDSRAVDRLVALFRDIALVKSTAHPAEEARLEARSLAGAAGGGREGALPLPRAAQLGLTRENAASVDRIISYHFRSSWTLLRTLQTGRLGITTPKGVWRGNSSIHKIATFAIFLWRHKRAVVGAVPFYLRVAANPAVWKNFFLPLLTNARTSQTPITSLPVIRTFSAAGTNVAFDPQANFVGEEMSAMALEAHLVRERFRGGCYDRACWWIYLTRLMAEGEPEADYWGRRPFLFLSRYLYDTVDHEEDLFAVDMMAFRRLQKHTGGGASEGSVDGVDLDRVATETKLAVAQFTCLDDRKLRTYLRHFYDHGI